MLKKQPPTYWCGFADNWSLFKHFKLTLFSWILLLCLFSIQGCNCICFYCFFFSHFVSNTPHCGQCLLFTSISSSNRTPPHQFGTATYQALLQKAGWHEGCLPSSTWAEVTKAALRGVKTGLCACFQNKPRSSCWWRLLRRDWDVHNWASSVRTIRKKSTDVLRTEVTQFYC